MTTANNMNKNIRDAVGTCVCFVLPLQRSQLKICEYMVCVNAKERQSTQRGKEEEEE